MAAHTALLTTILRHPNPQNILPVLSQHTMIGPFIAGTEVTTADGALFPTFVFLRHILPKYFGWKDVFAGRPKLAAWWDAISKDPEAAKVGLIMMSA